MFGDYVVLDKLSDHIAYCHERARKCALQADTIDDPEARRAYLASERRWLMLAASYEIAGRSDDDSDEASPAIALLKEPRGAARHVSRLWRAHAAALGQAPSG
jgi:hypothetical protein